MFNTLTRAALALLLTAGAAFAQSSPNLITGQVPTAAQWNSYFAAKQNLLGFTPVNKAGDVMLGRLVTAAATSGGANFNILPGSTPGLFRDGDMWTTTSGLFVRINGATIGPLNAGISGVLTSAHILVGNGSNVATSVAVSGDGSMSNTGAITVTKTNGVNFGSFATGTDAANLTSASPGVPLFAAGVPTFVATTGSNNFVRATGPAVSGGTFDGLTRLGIGTTPTGDFAVQNNSGNAVSTFQGLGAGRFCIVAETVATNVFTIGGNGAPCPAIGYLNIAGSSGTAGINTKTDLSALLNFPAANSGEVINLFTSSSAASRTGLGKYANEFRSYLPNSDFYTWYFGGPSGSEAMRLTGGSLGIGTTAPNSLTGGTLSGTILQVAGGGIVTAAVGGSSFLASDTSAASNVKTFQIVSASGSTYLRSLNDAANAITNTFTQFNLSTGKVTFPTTLAFTGIPTATTPGCLGNDASGNISGGQPCTGGGLPNGGSLGQALYKFSGSNGDANWYTSDALNISTVPGIDCSGVVASDTAFASAISGFINIMVPPNCTIKLSASHTVGVGRKFIVSCGAAISVDNTFTLTINSSFPDPGPCLSPQMFQGAGSVVGISSVRCEWWGCSTGSSGATNSTAIAKAIASVEGSGSTQKSESKITFTCGTFSIAATVKFNMAATNNWTVQACGGNSGTTLIAAASFTGAAAMWFDGASTVPTINLSGIALLNDTAGSGPTYGLLIGPTTCTPVCLMNGYHSNPITDINVSGFNKNISQQNARLFTYYQVSTNVFDNHGVEAINTVGFECTAAAGSFCGDMDIINSQTTGQTTPRASYTASISGTTMTVTAVASGTIAIGQGVSGDCCSLGVIPGTVITGGSGTTWTVNQSQTVSSRGMHASLTGVNVLLSDGGNASAGVAGIRFTSFISYGSHTHMSFSQTGTGGQVKDTWVLPGSQFEGADGSGNMVQFFANAGQINNINFNGVYGSGNGFDFNFLGNVASSGALQYFQLNNNFLSNTNYQFIDLRGTGGGCGDLNISGNTLRSPGADGASNSTIYMENCSTITAIGNRITGPGTTRPHLFTLNSGGDYVTCMSNVSGGLISGSVCDNAAVAAHFKIGGTDTNQ